MSVSLLVIAKAPAPGRSKTRLCPPLTLEQAALIAEAALIDTLEAMVAAPIGGRRVIVLDGAPDPWRSPSWDVVPQRGRGLDERLANAFADTGGPALLVGMDTPQVSGALLAMSAETLLRPGVDAVIGGTPDGGYWAIGLREADPAVFLGIPMSTSRTLAAQRRRLRSLGLTVRDLPTLRDVDTFDDAACVAPLAPATHFARAFGAIVEPSAAGAPS